MKLEKNHIIIISIAAVLVFFSFVLQPFLHRREATRITNEVLTRWVHDDLTEVYEYWIDKNKTPPIYGLDSYKILDKSFGKKDGQLFAKINVILEFPPGNILPSGKEWVFDLRDTKIGWMIKDLSLASP